MPPRSLRLLTLAACVFAVCGAGLAAWRQDVTSDEPFHLLWSERLLTTGETERASHDQLNSKTPVSLANVLAGRAAQALGVTQPRPLRFAQRLPTLLWLALLLAATFACARAVSGESAAYVATTAVALDPNLVAHGSLATVDCLYALATLLTLFAAISFARAPSFRGAARVGLALGLALAAKFTGLLLVGGLLLTRLAAPAQASKLWRDRKRVLLSVLIVALTATCVVDLAYLAQGLARPIASLQLGSTPFRFLARTLPGLRLPLPAAFLEGIDVTLRSERGWGAIVLLGRSHPDGVFYYFPVVWALKTPLLLLLLTAVGLAQLARSGALRRDPALRFLALNLLLTLLYFSFLFKTQIGFRYVLMCVPIACVLAAAALSEPRWRTAWLLAFALAFAENAAYLGNPLSFTHAAVWPKRQVFRLMADSNVDWGQNRDKIQGWLAGSGIRAARLDPVHVLPGTNVLSVTNAGGVFDFERHRWLREHLDPVAHFGHTYLRFEVDYEAFDRYMDERRTLPSSPSAEDPCPIAPADGEPFQKQFSFLRESEPASNGAWLACVTAPRGTDLGYRVTDGMIRVGQLLADGRCEAELIQHEQVVWYRLTPGRHALCLIEVTSRRKLAPYRAEGVFVLRGHGGSLAMIPATVEADGRLRPLQR